MDHLLVDFLNPAYNRGQEDRVQELFSELKDE